MAVQNGCKNNDLTSASEVASFAYCPEQWRLEYGLKLEASNQVERMAGNRHHAAKAHSEALAGGLLRLGRIVAVIAFLGLLLLFWCWLS